MFGANQFLDSGYWILDSLGTRSTHRDRLRPRRGTPAGANFGTGRTAYTPGIFRCNIPPCGGFRPYGNRIRSGARTSFGCTAVRSFPLLFDVVVLVALRLVKLAATHHRTALGTRRAAWSRMFFATSSMATTLAPMKTAIPTTPSWCSHRSSFLCEVPQQSYLLSPEKEVRATVVGGPYLL